MLRSLRAFLLIAMGGCAAVGQQGPVAQELTGVGHRGERIVLASPHFDDPPPVISGLNCPAAPVYLIGFEGRAASRAATELTMRTLKHPNARRDPFEAALSDVLVRVVERIDDRETRLLPAAPPWVLITDSAGYGNLVVPSGVYRVQFQWIGYRPGIGTLQLRAADGDSLHVYMDAAAAC